MHPWLSRYLDWLEATNHAAATRRNSRSAVERFLRWAGQAVPAVELSAVRGRQKRSEIAGRIGTTERNNGVGPGSDQRPLVFQDLWGPHHSLLFRAARPAMRILAGGA